MANDNLMKEMTQHVEKVRGKKKNTKNKKNGNSRYVPIPGLVLNNTKPKSKKKTKRKPEDAVIGNGLWRMSSDSVKNHNKKTKERIDKMFK